MMNGSNWWIGDAVLWRKAGEVHTQVFDIIDRCRLWDRCRSISDVSQRFTQLCRLGSPFAPWNDLGWHDSSRLTEVNSSLYFTLRYRPSFFDERSNLMTEAFQNDSGSLLMTEAQWNQVFTWGNTLSTNATLIIINFKVIFFFFLIKLQSANTAYYLDGCQWSARQRGAWPLRVD